LQAPIRASLLALSPPWGFVLWLAAIALVLLGAWVLRGRSRASLSAANASSADPSSVAPAEPLPRPLLELPWLTVEKLRDLAQNPIGPTTREEIQAYRLARLLVTELVEFNEAKVEEGRRQGNLAARLELDLQKSREAYLELTNCPDKDFLLQELLHVVAQGRVERFGL
jgi:hypothetical protein